MTAYERAIIHHKRSVVYHREVRVSGNHTSYPFVRFSAMGTSSGSDLWIASNYQPCLSYGTPYSAINRRGVMSETVLASVINLARIQALMDES